MSSMEQLTRHCMVWISPSLLTETAPLGHTEVSADNAVAATYDKYGRLLEVKMVTLTPTDGSQTFAFTFADQQNMTCRLFFLDADLQPLCKAIEA